MGNLSAHLTTEEFRCGGVSGSCCGKLPPVMYDDGYLLTCYDYLFETFEALRAALGRPLVITSGYRCAKHNAEVGGEPMSPHRYGLALDIAVKSKLEAEDFAATLRGLGRDVRIGYKKYAVPTFHYDLAYMVWPRPSEFFVPGVCW